MLSVNDFIEKYKGYSDEELFIVNSEIDQYSEEARAAFAIVLEKKGDIEKIKENLSNKNVISNEINRVKMEVTSLRSKETNPDFVKTFISSSILSKIETDKIVDESFEEFTANLKANSIDSKAIIFASLGIVISSIIAGILWSWIIKQTNRIPIFLIVGLGLLCYFTIILFTKKSKSSPLVIISTIIAFILSVLIGQFLAPLAI
jgi:hypothetical protein